MSRQGRSRTGFVSGHWSSPPKEAEVSSEATNDNLDHINLVDDAHPYSSKPPLTNLAESGCKADSRRGADTTS